MYRTQENKNLEICVVSKIKNQKYILQSSSKLLKNRNHLVKISKLNIEQSLVTKSITNFHS